MIKNYLALGDSYTIGEQVEIIFSFPYQLVQMLRKSGHDFNAPEIVAKTGWTTDELLGHMAGYSFLDKYDIVTLLIGVNNQYRGRSAGEFEPEFRDLLNKAMSMAKDSSGVYVLSIPDWGRTPFAEARNRDQIAQEINEYNEICKRLSAEHQVRFFDITESQRIDAENEIYLAPDKLHPSAMEYRKWAGKLLNHFNHLPG